MYLNYWTRLLITSTNNMVLAFTKTALSKSHKVVKTRFEEKIKKGVKLHTIREDPKDRWMKGRKIHFATGVRSSRYNCFKKGVCKSVQKVVIYADPKSINFGSIEVDGRLLDPSEAEYFIINDGFDNADEFWWWFEPYGVFTGKVIHWTGLEY